MLSLEQVLNQEKAGPNAYFDEEEEDAKLRRDTKRARLGSPDPLGLVAFLSEEHSRPVLRVQIPMDRESDPSDKRAKFGDSEESDADTKEASDSNSLDNESDFDSPSPDSESEALSDSSFAVV